MQVAVQALHDGRRHGLGAQNALEGINLGILDTQLGQRGHIGQRGNTLGRTDGQGAHLARLDHGQARRQVQEHAGDLAPITSATAGAAPL